MKFLLTIFVFFTSNTAFACEAGGSFGKGLIEDAYFIGLVEKVDYQKYDNGFFKQATLKPYMVYKSKKDMPLNEDIIISNDMKWTACDYYSYPEDSRIIEVIIVNGENGYELVHREMVYFMEEKLEELRKKARYVGDSK